MSKNYATLGGLDDGIEVDDLSDKELAQFENHHTAYKVVDGVLVLDEEKLAADMKAAEAEMLSRLYIPNTIQSVAAIGQMMLAQLPDLDDDSRIRVSGLYETWTPGKYEVGDVRNYSGQSWECFQATTTPRTRASSPKIPHGLHSGDRSTVSQ